MAAETRGDAIAKVMGGCAGLTLKVVERLVVLAAALKILGVF